MRYTHVVVYVSQEVAQGRRERYCKLISLIGANLEYKNSMAVNWASARTECSTLGHTIRTSTKMHFQLS